MNIRRSAQTSEALGARARARHAPACAQDKPKACSTLPRGLESFGE